MVYIELLLNIATYPNTVCAVHLVHINFGELACDVNWQVFSLVTRAIHIA